MTNLNRKLTNGFLLIVLIVILVLLSLNAYHLTTKPSGPQLFSSLPVWTFETKDRITGTPIIYHDIAIVRTVSGVFIIDVNNGHELGFFESPGTGTAIRPPVVCGNTLLVPESQATILEPESKTGLLAISLPSMAILWRVPYSSTYGPLETVETISCSERIAAVARYSQEITAYDLTNGEIIWRQAVQQREFNDLLVTNSQLFRSRTREIVVLDLNTGEEIRQRVGDDLVGRLNIVGTSLFSIQGSGSGTKIVSYDLETLNKHWSLSIPASQGTVRTYIAVHREVLLVSNDHLTAIDPSTGKILWQSNEIRNLEEPVGLGETVYVRDRDQLYGFDLFTGELLGTMKLRNKAPRTHEAQLNTGAGEQYLLIPVGADKIEAYQP